MLSPHLEVHRFALQCLYVLDTYSLSDTFADSAGHIAMGYDVRLFFGLDIHGPFGASDWIPNSQYVPQHARLHYKTGHFGNEKYRNICILIAVLHLEIEAPSTTTTMIIMPFAVSHYLLRWSLYKFLYPQLTQHNRPRMVEVMSYNHYHRS